MKMFRWLFAIVVACCLTIGIGSVADAKLIIRLSNQLPPGQPLSKSMDLFKKLVETKTNKEVVVEVYHAGQLYSDREIFSAIQNGSIEAGLVIVVQIAAYDPLFAVFDQPFLTASYDALTAACDGKVGEILSQRAEKLDVKIIGWPQQGFMHVANRKKKIEVPKDFEGVKFRAHTGEWVDIIKSLGGAAVVLPAGDTYTALSRGTVDGVSTSLASFYSRKWYEESKYLLISNITSVPMPLCINKKFWDGLPNNYKSIILECAKEAEKAATMDNMENDKKVIEITSKSGVEISYIKEKDRPLFLEKVKPVTSVFLKRTGDVGKMLIDYVHSLNK